MSWVPGSDSSRPPTPPLQAAALRRKVPWLQYNAAQAQYQADKAAFLAAKDSLVRMEAEQAEQEGPLRERHALEKKKAGEYRRLTEEGMRKHTAVAAVAEALATTVSRRLACTSRRRACTRTCVICARIQGGRHARASPA